MNWYDVKDHSGRIRSLPDSSDLSKNTCPPAMNYLCSAQPTEKSIVTFLFVRAVTTEVAMDNS